MPLSMSSWPTQWCFWELPSEWWFLTLFSCWMLMLMLLVAQLDTQGRWLQCRIRKQVVRSSCLSIYYTQYMYNLFTVYICSIDYVCGNPFSPRKLIFKSSASQQGAAQLRLRYTLSYSSSCRRKGRRKVVGHQSATCTLNYRWLWLVNSKEAIPKRTGSKSWAYGSRWLANSGYNEKIEGDSDLLKLICKSFVCGSKPIWCFFCLIW